MRLQWRWFCPNNLREGSFLTPEEEEAGPFYGLEGMMAEKDLTQAVEAEEGMRRRRGHSPRLEGKKNNCSSKKEAD